MLLILVLQLGQREGGGIDIDVPHLPQMAFSGIAIRIKGLAMKPQASGTLLYRRVDGTLEVLLVHPSGNYNRKKPWSIPKGLCEPGESLEETARRETLEETGVTAGELTEMGSIDYRKSKKRVHCFVGRAQPDAAPICASWEVDRAEFVELESAREVLHPDQVAFLDRLEEHLESTEL